MKSVLVIQILALWVTVSKSQISITQCPRTECVEGYLDPNDHRVCEVIPAGQSYPLVQMGECKNSGEFCDDNSGAPTIRCKLYQFHPGRYVEKVSQCLSGKMSGGYCIGNLVNEGCKKDVDCNIGLYCALPPLNQICTPLVAHQAECDDTKKCVPYTRCVGIKGSKTCEYLSSQPLKVTVGTGNGIACMSGFEDGGVCAQSWEHNGDPLQDFDKKCTITWQGNDVTNDPRFLGPATPYCRYRQDGKGLCNLSPSALTAQRNGVIYYIIYYILYIYRFKDSQVNIIQTATLRMRKDMEFVIK